MAFARVGADGTADWALPLLRQRNLDELRAGLDQRLADEGLSRFVIDTVPALNQCVGDAWSRGEIAVFEEHLYAELLQNQLRAAIFALPRRGTRPQVLLTTLKGEEHVLGLLMVEALLVADGAWCLSLGAQTPVAEITAATLATTTDIIAISCSGAYPWPMAREALLEVRAALPERIDIWAGGAGLAGHGPQLGGIRCMQDIGEIPTALTAWRERQGQPGRMPA